MSQSHRSRSCAVVLAFLALLVIAPTVARAATMFLPFEDIYGPCPDLGFTQGPGTTTIQGVTFASPDPYTWNFGKGGSDRVFLTTPFQSDWLALNAYDAGVTITFPEPITALAFDNGTQDTLIGNEFRLLVGNTLVRTFASRWDSLNHVAATFVQPTSSVRIQWIPDSGPASLLGIDSLTYTTVPEPAGAGVVVGATLCRSIMRRRRRR